MAEVPSGGVFGTPWQVFGTLGPTRKKQMDYSKGHFCGGY